MEKKIFVEEFDNFPLNKDIKIVSGDWNSINNSEVTLSSYSEATINRNYSNFEFEIQVKFLNQKSRMDLKLRENGIEIITSPEFFSFSGIDRPNIFNSQHAKIALSEMSVGKTFTYTVKAITNNAKILINGNLIADIEDIPLGKGELFDIVICGLNNSPIAMVGRISIKNIQDDDSNLVETLLTSKPFPLIIDDTGYGATVNDNLLLISTDTPDNISFVKVNPNNPAEGFYLICKSSYLTASEGMYEEDRTTSGNTLTTNTDITYAARFMPEYIGVENCYYLKEINGGDYLTFVRSRYRLFPKEQNQKQKWAMPMKWLNGNASRSGKYANTIKNSKSNGKIIIQKESLQFCCPNTKGYNDDIDKWMIIPSDTEKKEYFLASYGKYTGKVLFLTSIGKNDPLQVNTLKVSNDINEAAKILFENKTNNQFCLLETVSGNYLSLDTMSQSILFARYGTVNCENLWNIESNTNPPERIQPRSFGTNSFYTKIINELYSKDKVCFIKQELYECNEGLYCVNANNYSKTWNFSENNLLSDNWLLNTPNIWGKKDIPDGHSNILLNKIYDFIFNAKFLIDITTLTPPTGRFFETIHKALIDLSRKESVRKPVVRILVSSQNPLPNSFLLKDLTAGINDFDPMNIYVGAYKRFSLIGLDASWNHSKIIAVDGERAIVGGHNLWDDNYLGKNPAFDVSMEVKGAAVIHAHDYASALWDNIIDLMTPEFINLKPGGYCFDEQCVRTTTYEFDPNNKINVLTQNIIGNVPTTESDFYKSFKIICRKNNLAIPQSVPIISVGRLGLINNNLSNQSDIAINKMLNMAENSIYMSLQRLKDLPLWLNADLFVADWNEELFEILAKKIHDKVHIYIFLSGPNAVAGNKPEEYDGGNLQKVYDRLWRQDYSNNQYDLKTYFHLYNFQYSNTSNYSNNSIPNHAKTFMVDEQAFYIGSQNLYMSNLAEFGFIVDNSDKAKEFKEKYWEPLKKYSKEFINSVPYPQTTIKYTFHIVGIKCNKTRDGNHWYKSDEDEIFIRTLASSTKLLNWPQYSFLGCFSVEYFALGPLISDSEMSWPSKLIRSGEELEIDWGDIFTLDSFVTCYPFSLYEKDIFSADVITTFRIGINEKLNLTIGKMTFDELEIGKKYSLYGNSKMNVNYELQFIRRK